MRRKALKLCLASAVTAAVAFGMAGTADAATGSATGDHFEVIGNNNPENAGGRYAYICNYQSGPNDFYFWVWDNQWGSYAALIDGSGTETWGKVHVWVAAGTCTGFAVGAGNGHSIEVFGQSSGYTNATQSIAWG
ncbi:hypothetical protein OG455_36860 [Kitasatospora sp. NBC_01287]|uniref:hypothetical protein n=1 Tax=Kitasatospora sp. NBC_01287 TaxID=2903573 RepID=UPI002259284F|nr:hypothetical protein [Kitasatospora sp. NBC_01287]MCX4751015.1 hypothetical protein [Kitasatospora sp. NBC_01287]